MAYGFAKRLLAAALVAGTLAGAAGCARHDSEAAADGTAASAVAAPAAPPAEGGSADKPDLGVLLAYQHRVLLRLPGERIATQAQAVRAGCDSGKFGACAVLEMSQTGGDFPSAMVQVRIVPAGVEPLVALAGKGEEISDRSIQADDLAAAVRDNAMLRDRLQKEHARLLEFQQRDDLKLADVLTLSNRIAELEAQLQGAQQEAAQQQRRISTQLITFDFETTRSQASRSEIGEAFRDFGGIVASVVAFLIRAIAVLLPLTLAVLPLLWLLRRYLRKRRQARGG
ncbi:DUF4349 domain-containing protein [Lysobacter sp. BMK333-48F3]|uniref:DUF4349 domain-containing protein n=1 Tax=Lysobacter sp. BMK333-48F3 TaxID=2867962 RepID=UPI001C8CCF6C|nr:DUF4349 domain-containing protein [Lysobacter sp. BMK333-48F3]MBX9402191.1 DUF4349 domain-containing protein [Lysobacter sp. BMK333-48F3]